MTLPACLTKFDAAEFAASEARPKRFYEVILSRRARAFRLTETTIGMWASVPTTRCLLSHEGIEERRLNGFLICILREFDELPQ